MGTKENIEYIKNELSSDEKILEELIKTERFLKKYKKPLIGAFAALIIGIAGYGGYEWKRSWDLQRANAIYLQLLQSPQAVLEEELAQKDHHLYELYLYQKAVHNKDVKLLEKLTKSEDPLIAELARYHLAALSRDTKKLRSVILAHNMLQDLAVVDEAYILDKQGQSKKARKELANIQKSSVVFDVAQLLQHFGAKASR